LCFGAVQARDVQLWAGFGWVRANQVEFVDVGRKGHVYPVTPDLIPDFDRKEGKVDE